MNNSLNSPTAMVTYSMSADEFEAFAERKKQEGKQEAMEELKANNTLQKPTLTRKEAMDQLGISESTIIDWGRRGLIRFVKRGHRCWYFQRDVDRILNNGTGSIHYTI